MTPCLSRFQSVYDAASIRFFLTTIQRLRGIKSKHSSGEAIILDSARVMVIIYVQVEVGKKIRRHLTV
jgi:hypothetical protein